MMILNGRVGAEAGRKKIYSNIDNITPEQYKAISRNSADKVEEGFADLIVAKIKKKKKPN